MSSYSDHLLHLSLHSYVIDLQSDFHHAKNVIQYGNGDDISSNGGTEQKIDVRQ